MKSSTLLLLVATLALSACHKDKNSSDPIGGTASPPAGETQTTPQSSTGTVVSSGTTTTTTTTVPPTSGGTAFTIFSNELASGGGAFLYPGGENQTLSFDDRSTPSSGNAIRYSWNGRDVAGQHAFAGFDLMHAPELADYTSTPGKDLRSKNYSRVVFDARGSLTANVVVKVEAADDGNIATPAPCIVLSASGQEDDATPGNPPSCMARGTLTGSWQRFSLPVSASDLASVKDYFKATLIYKNAAQATGTGGTVYFDEVSYQP